MLGMRTLRCMAHPTTVEHLFLKEPAQWGLRGDPWLWRAMRDRLEDVPLPATQGQLETLLADTFAQEVGTSLASAGRVFVEGFAHGGMSSGTVDGDWWRNNGMPTLTRRWVSAIRR